ncbi:hypothetical protein SAY87_019150 [Trapa incisa]|uniref:Uncharacterized protein n=1 Tax=Trapa incisa TaxID=236973 RepID=A0AAN7Q2D9_9MYRT|nr:hypothetical protein SAY87_019150 [Trapa incisa]
MGRAPCCDKANVKRGPWSPVEDAILRSYMEAQGGAAGNWIALPKKAGLRRCGKSCRLRWLNYLRPNIRHGNFTEEEDNIIIQLYNQIGSRWSVIASQLSGRTDNDVKNYWNTKLKKRLSLPNSNGDTASSSTWMIDYNCQVFQQLPALEARPEMEMLSNLPMPSIDYGPGLMVQAGPSPNIRSIIDLGSASNSWVSNESLSINWSIHSPYSFGVAESSRPTSVSCSQGAAGGHGWTDLGFGSSWNNIINDLPSNYEEVLEISAPNALAVASPKGV